MDSQDYEPSQHSSDWDAISHDQPRESSPELPHEMYERPPVTDHRGTFVHGRQKLARLFIRGGMLDSQVTDSQWESTLTNTPKADDKSSAPVLVPQPQLVEPGGVEVSEEAEAEVRIATLTAENAHLRARLQVLESGYYEYCGRAAISHVRVCQLESALIDAKVDLPPYPQPQDVVASHKDDTHTCLSDRAMTATTIEGKSQFNSTRKRKRGSGIHTK